jgi:cell division protein FtsL
MAQNTGTTAVTKQLTAVAGGHHEQTTKRDFGVIEGRLDTATRIARFLGTTLLVTFVIALVGALVLHATIIENQRDLDAQRNAIVRIAAETEGMRSELAELEAPARIVEEARALGMIEAPSIEYLTAPGVSLDQRTLSIAANQLRDNE